MGEEMEADLSPPDPNDRKRPWDSFNDTVDHGQPARCGRARLTASISATSLDDTCSSSHALPMDWCPARSQAIVDTGDTNAAPGLMSDNFSASSAQPSPFTPTPPAVAPSYRSPTDFENETDMSWPDNKDHMKASQTPTRSTFHQSKTDIDSGVSSLPTALGNSLISRIPVDWPPPSYLAAGNFTDEQKSGKRRISNRTVLKWQLCRLMTPALGW
jgi:hypothetical protein